MIEYSDKIIELAKDTNVEMVVCAVRVDRHFPTISPSLRAGKSAFVEWPLGKNLAEAQELAKLSKEHGAKRTAVDLQARFAPIVRTLKRLTEE
jgi:predicted dehydrogenase